MVGSDSAAAKAPVRVRSTDTGDDRHLRTTADEGTEDEAIVPNLFYYPKINAPQSVIYQALLYWDRLITVAPAGPIDEFLGPQMRRVNDAGCTCGCLPIGGRAATARWSEQCGR